MPHLSHYQPPITSRAQDNMSCIWQTWQRGDNFLLYQFPFYDYAISTGGEDCQHLLSSKVYAAEAKLLT